MTFPFRRRPEPDPLPVTSPAVDGVTDAELVQRVLDGNEQAFNDLVARYSRRAFWIAYHVVGRIEDARDVVQEAFVRLHRGLRSYDFSRSFYTWFYRIVTNLAIDSLRRTRAARATGLDEFAESIPAPGDDVEAPAERDETKTQVWGVLDSLDAKFRAVLVLRDIHGLSCREIAPILKVTHATVRWRLNRGRQLFREGWERQQSRATRSGETWA
jgi:RNA polymerase sigma-70 factor (ECF subfamily)